jgi:ATP-dependent Lhr-like helicase
VQTRRSSDDRDTVALGVLDGSAIAMVRAEAAPDPRDEDELHDTLVTVGVLTAVEVSRHPEWQPLFDALASCGRATRASASGWPSPLWVAAERVPEIRAINAGVQVEPIITPPALRSAVSWTRASAAVELLRGRLGILGPATPRALGDAIGLTAEESLEALLALEAEGVVLRGWFSPGGLEEEYCDRRLLARIHRATLQRLRAEIQPVSVADFMRFLFEWQHLSQSSRVSGIDGLRKVLGQLDGFELAADAWDAQVLPARVQGYDPSMLDLLCYGGEVAWARLTPPPAPSPSAILPPRPVRATPVAVFQRDHGPAWRILARAGEPCDPLVSDLGRQVLAVLERGAQFAHEIAAAMHATVHDAREALAELVWAGLVASDGFSGLRSTWDAAARPSGGGRWSRLADGGIDGQREALVEQYARALLRRYGMVCRRLLAREPYQVPWRELLRVYRRLEARGEIRGGRFIAGVPGEQFALPDAVAMAREVRRRKPQGETITISAVDPLNVCGILDGGERVTAVASTRIAFRDGVRVTTGIEENLANAAHTA